MCGIFAYIGNDDKSVLKAIRGLKDLEYRGYDSWGVAVKTSKGIFCKKDVGKISDVQERGFEHLRGSVSLGHTRWATHGRVSSSNTHPHFNKDKTIAVIHNGIIENYRVLKRELEKKFGAKLFRSKTDTEVIPHLIDSLLRQGLSFEKAFAKTCRKLKGRFAFVALYKDAPFILAARDGSPLVVGRGEKEFFIASDITAFLDYTNVVNFVENGEYIKTDGNKILFYNFRNGRGVKKANKKISWGKLEAHRRGWKHFMLKEIMEQRDILPETLALALSDIGKATRLIKKSDHVLMTACGTAAHVGMVGEYIFSSRAGASIQLIHSSEFHKVVPFLNKGSTVITITQSGETADLLEAIESAKKNCANIVSLVNVRGSSVERESDIVIPVNAGPEKAVASTKTALAQLALLFLLAFSLAGELKGGEKILRDSAQALKSWLTKRLLVEIKRIAKRIAASDNLYIVGKSSHYPIALETALKIKEVSYIHAEGFPAGELKHGPIALIEKGTPCLMLVANDEFKDDVLSSAEELKARGAFLIGVSPKENALFDRWIPVPDLGIAAPLANLVVGQILAYYLAILRGHDPDKPRNLAKSVTVK